MIDSVVITIEGRYLEFYRFLKYLYLKAVIVVEPWAIIVYPKLMAGIELEIPILPWEDHVYWKENRNYTFQGVML